MSMTVFVKGCASLRKEKLSCLVFIFRSFRPAHLKETSTRSMACTDILDIIYHYLNKFVEMGLCGPKMVIKWWTCLAHTHRVVFSWFSFTELVSCICVLDSKKGWWLDCGIRDSYLFRIKDLGGLQANFDFSKKFRVFFFFFFNTKGVKHTLTRSLTF